MPTRRQFSLGALSLGSLGLGAGGLGVPARALAQAGIYPARPIRLIVPFAAGGGPDVLTRRMAPKLTEVLGRSRVVVDNIVGAGGIVAAQSVARMAPDGYNLLLCASTHIVQKAMQPSVQFDPLKDFAHITRTAFSPSILVVSASSPYKSVEDIIAAARREPGRLNYASGGVGSAAHLCGAAMVLQAKIDVVHVPYKGSVDIVPSILAGATQFAFPIASTAIPQIKAGTVRALAVTSAQRVPFLPDVPTLVEVFRTADLALDSWFGLWAPAGTPPEVVELLFKAVVKTYDDPSVRADSEAAGAVVALSSSPSEFTTFLEAETRKLDKIVKSAHLSVAR